MCWKPPYKRLKTKTDETKNTTQYVLETTIQKTQDEDRNKKHNTICVGNHHTKDSRRRQKQKTQHNMCWKPPYKRLKMKTDETKNIAQYVLETTIQKTQDKDRNKKHNTICVGNHHTKDSRRRQTKQKT